MGRPPIGKTAMTGAERVQRYRLKHNVTTRVTKRSDKVARLEAELAQARQRIAERSRDCEAEGGR